jgi:long-chain acyl-CoA synthetase
MISRTMYSILEAAAARGGSLPALYQPVPGAPHRVYSWNDFAAAAREIATGLRGLGLGRGTIIGLASEARAEFCLADLGIMANGSVAAALYTSYPVRELARELRACDAQALFVESPALLRALKADPQFPPNLPVILLNGTAIGVMTLEDLRSQGRAAMERDPELFPRIAAEVTPEDGAILYLTSGATGEPKMGLVTHDALVSNVELGPKVLDIGPEDSVLAFLPPAHITQRLALQMLPIYCGVPVWFAESLMKLPDEFLRVKPTVFVAPPRLWEKVHASIRTEVRKRGRLVSALFDRAVRLGLASVKLRMEGRRTALPKRVLLAAADRIFFRRMRARFGGRLRICGSGSAPLGKELAGFFLAIGMPLIEGYGLTEGGVVILNPPGQTRPGSVGKPLPSVEVQIASDGELLVRASTLFSGYYKDPQATAEVLRDGWLHTGDLAEIDSDGYVYITGRKKDVIVLSNGRKIYPAHIESLLRLDPLINQVLLVGDGQPYVSALVTVKTEPQPAFDRAAIEALVRRVVARVNKGLASFEQVRKFHVLDRDFSIELGELTATLKVRRPHALENFRDAVALLYPVQERE